MGLDMYSHTHKKLISHSEDPGAVTLSHEDDIEDLAYWRKFNALHNWMVEYYDSLEGNQEFNCVYMELDAEALDKLMQACLNKELKPTEGFFFGSQDPVTDEEYESVLQFISEAQDALAKGLKVTYSAWY